MSKLGRHSADRKKVEALTASKTCGVEHCGTVFTAVGDAALTVALPTIAVAGKGWWCKVIKTGSASGGQGITIAAHADDGSTPMMGVELSPTHAVMNGDDIVIEDAANKGTQVELLCDGTYWHVLGFSVLAAGITIG
tara:strand:+ start:30 stop:440 length:411 start_codon:yes stop_codon:yes gene_type:complete